MPQIFYRVRVAKSLGRVEDFRKTVKDAVVRDEG